MTALEQPYTGSVYTVAPYGKGLVTLTDRGDISAKDGWKTANIPGLAEVRTAQTIAMSEYLRDCDIAMAYIRPVSTTAVLQKRVTMLAGEFVVRRHKIGSWQERYPGEAKQRSATLVFELFAKQSLDCRDFANVVMVDGNALRREFTAAAGGDQRAGWKLLEAQIDGKRIFMDPLVQLRPCGNWQVYDAHAPFHADLPLHALPAPIDAATEKACWQIAEQAFLALEDGLSRIDCDKVGLPGLRELLLADIKFEFGHTADGQLVLADVVNLDSLRLLKNGGYEKKAHLSKQVFRDNEVDNAAVLQVYRHGLEAVRQLAA